MQTMPVAKGDLELAGYVILMGDQCFLVLLFQLKASD